MGTSELSERYEIVRTIARGGMADILEAIDLDGRRVAIKLLREGLHDDEDIAARFHREARLAASLESRHVAKIFDFGSNEKNQPFIAMELLTGNDLAAEIRQRGALPLEEAASYVAQTCHAMIEAHDAGIVHRDLKPPNLFLAEEGEAKRVLKVLDFGISKATKGPGDGHVTLTQTLFGSPLYMSPEAFQSTKAADARSDVWSLGVIFYEMLTGVPPFDAENAWTIGLAVTKQEQVPPTERRAYLPRAADVVVGRALKKDPNDRYQSMRELLAAIEVFLPHGRNETMMLKQVDAPDTAEDEPLTAQMSREDAASLIKELVRVEAPSRADDPVTTSSPSIDQDTFDGPTRVAPIIKPLPYVSAHEEETHDPPTLVEIARPPSPPALPEDPGSEEPETRVERSDAADPPTWVRPDASIASVHAALSNSVKRARAANDPEVSTTADTDRAVNISTVPDEPSPKRRRKWALWLIPLVAIGSGIGVFLTTQKTPPSTSRAQPQTAAVEQEPPPSEPTATALAVSATPSLTASLEIAPPDTSENALSNSASEPHVDDAPSATPSASARPDQPRAPSRRRKTKYYPKGI